MNSVSEYVNALLYDARCFRCLPVATQWEAQTYIMALANGETNPDPLVLAEQAKCLTCLSWQSLMEIRSYLLAAMNETGTDPDTMILNARCFDCIPEGMQTDVQTYLLAQDPSVPAITDLTAAIQAVSAWQVLAPITLLQIQVYQLASIAGVSTDPNDLIALAKCMKCIPNPMLVSIATQSLEYMEPVPSGSAREPLTPPTIPGGGGTGRGGGLHRTGPPTCTDNLTDLIPFLTPTYTGFTLQTATATITRNCCVGGVVLISGSDDYLFGTGNIITTVTIPPRIAHYTTAAIDLSAGGYDYYRARVICDDGLISDWSNVIGAIFQPFDYFEQYSNGDAVTGLDGGVDWSCSYDAHDPLKHTYAFDDFESYTDGAAVAGLNAGTGWSGSYGT